MNENLPIGSRYTYTIGPCVIEYEVVGKITREEIDIEVTKAILNRNVPALKQIRLHTTTTTVTPLGETK